VHSEGGSPYVGAARVAYAKPVAVIAPLNRMSYTCENRAQGSASRAQI
jgi:hypothetical protein